MKSSTKVFSKFWFLALAVCLTGCPTTEGLQQPYDASGAAAVAPSFVCGAEGRKEQFMTEAAKLQVAKADAAKLYAISGAESMDVVTGFAPARDRSPTVERALESVAMNPELKAFYVEVDIQNLGGLNAELGHSGADVIFGEMTAITERHIQKLKPDSCSFRHGGDEFSFVVIGPGASQEAIEATLQEADDEIRMYIASQGLSKIPHPKHLDDPSKFGAGIIFGVSPIAGQKAAKDVYGVADKIVESRKSQ